MLVLLLRWLAKWPEATRCRIVGYPTERDIRRRGVSLPKKLNLVLLASSLLFRPGAGQELRQVRRVVVFYELGTAFPGRCAR